MGRHCPAPLVDLDSTTSSSTSSSDSEPSLAQFDLCFWTLYGPRIPGTPLPNNPIPAHTLYNLTYVRTATAMVDKIVALTGDACSLWLPSDPSLMRPSTPFLPPWHSGTTSLARWTYHQHTCSSGITVSSATALVIGDESMMNRDLTGSLECWPATFLGWQRPAEAEQPTGR
ncbi:hypothetical protein J3A83DRAFT_4380056 [Scleroderma citrinum]